MTSIGSSNNDNTINSKTNIPINQNASKPTDKKEVNTVSEKVSNLIKTPEGKAMATGMLLKVMAPLFPIGDAIILGGAACAAKKHLLNDGDTKDALIKNVTSPEGRIITGAAIAPLSPILGITIATTGIIDKTEENLKNLTQNIAENALEATSNLVKNAAKNTLKELGDFINPNKP